MNTITGLRLFSAALLAAGLGACTAPQERFDICQTEEFPPRLAAQLKDRADYDRILALMFQSCPAQALLLADAPTATIKPAGRVTARGDDWDAGRGDAPAASAPGGSGGAAIPSAPHGPVETPMPVGPILVADGQDDARAPNDGSTAPTGQGAPAEEQAPAGATQPAQQDAPDATTPAPAQTTPAETATPGQAPASGETTPVETAAPADTDSPAGPGETATPVEETPAKAPKPGPRKSENCGSKGDADPGQGDPDGGSCKNR